MSADGELKPPLSLLQLATIFRQRVDDLPGDIVDPDFSWENSDTGLLWSNAEICGYADEAQQELFLRRNKKDNSTPAITQITVVAGTATYAYDSRIQAIERVRFIDSNGDEYDVTKKTHEWMDHRYGHRWQQDGNGKVEHYIEDFEDYSLTLWRPPELAGTLNLTVRRLPLVRLSWNLRHALLETDPKHQLDLLDWMLFRAYLKKDAETENPDLAAIHKGLFDERVGPRPSVHLQQVRRQERNTDRRVRAQYF